MPFGFKRLFAEISIFAKVIAYNSVMVVGELWVLRIIQMVSDRLFVANNDFIGIVHGLFNEVLNQLVEGLTLSLVAVRFILG